MIFKKTIKSYSTKASGYSQDWLAQPAPKDMYKLLKKYFRPGLVTADIGCGNGRDANWLSQNGFKVVGYDSSLELLNFECFGWEGISHYMVAGWDTDAGQRIGPAVEIEGAGGTAPPLKVPRSPANLKVQ